MARPSVSTIGAQQSKEQLKPSNSHYTDSDSLDDSIIRGKIEEANQLIDRVKKALDKMKYGKMSKQEGQYSNTCSSTDIEDTIRNLAKQTERLLTCDKNEDQDPNKTKINPCCRNSIEEIPETLSSVPSSVPKLNTNEIQKVEETSSSCSSLNGIYVNPDNGRQATGHVCPQEPPSEDPRPKSRPSLMRDLEKSAEHILDSSRNKDISDLERPVTRRNEIEGDLPEERLLAKFRNCPSDGQIEVNSSFEELQAKLQTISESTESSLSTPRTLKNNSVQGLTLPKDVTSVACITEIPQTDSIEIQVESKKTSVATMTAYPRETKSSQTPKKDYQILTVCKSSVEAFIPQPKMLSNLNFNIQEIIPKSNEIRNWDVDNLPIVEVAPSPEKLRCDKCRKQLMEELLPVVSVVSNTKKVRKLTIKVLPPIIIDQQMIVTPVFNFFITSDGKTQNLLEETENAAFILLKNSEMIEDRAEPELEEEKEISSYNANSSEEQKSYCSVDATPSGRILASKNSKFFLKLRDDAVKNLDFTEAQLAKANTSNEDADRANLDEKTKQKLLIYKSYNIYDNPNTHNPEALDSESFERVSWIDRDVYRTFINPTGKVSEREMAFRKKSVSTFGFESKEIQCNPESLMMTTKDSNLPPTGPEDRIELIESAEKPSTITKKYTLKKISPFRKKLETDEMIPREKKSDILDHVEVPEVKTVQSIVEDLVKESEDLRSTILEFEPKPPTDQPELIGPESMYSQLVPGPSRPEESIVHSETSILRGSKKSEYSSPSEITLTISYTQSSEEGSLDIQNAGDQQACCKSKSTSLETDPNLKSDPKYTCKKESKSKKEWLQVKVNPLDLEKPKEIDLTDLGAEQSIESDVKVLTVKDKNVIHKLQEKFKSVDILSSDPKLILRNEPAEQETMEFIKELTRIVTTSKDDITGGATSEDIQNSNSQNVHYHLVDTDLNAKINFYSKHLLLAKNGRYKDEENLFTQNPHPKPTNQKSDSPRPSIERQDQEVQYDKLGVCPNRTLNRNPPETTSSDTEATNSLSEGEIRCRHSVSNGEIHVCKHGNPLLPHSSRRNILPRSNLTNPSMSQAPPKPRPRQILPRSNLTKASSSPTRYLSNQRNILNQNMRFSNRSNISNLMKFDFTDPNLTIEKRRNYFNNWVTYYVKNQEVNDSSTSSCGQNK